MDVASTPLHSVMMLGLWSGNAARYGAGHAWVSYFSGWKLFSGGASASALSRFPPAYHVELSPLSDSVAWTAKSLTYFVHKHAKFASAFWKRRLSPLILE